MQAFQLRFDQMGAAGFGSAGTDPASADAASGIFAGLLAALGAGPDEASGIASAAVPAPVQAPDLQTGTAGPAPRVAGSLPLQEGMDGEAPAGAGAGEPALQPEPAGLPVVAPVDAGRGGAARSLALPGDTSRSGAPVAGGDIAEDLREAGDGVPVMPAPVPVLAPVPAPVALPGLADGAGTAGDGGPAVRAPAGVPFAVAPAGGDDVEAAGPGRQQGMTAGGPVAAGPGTAPGGMAASAGATPDAVAQATGRDDPQMPGQMPTRSGAPAAHVAPAAGPGPAPVLTDIPVPKVPGSWETRVPEPGQDGTARFLAAAQAAEGPVVQPAGRQVARDDAAHGEAVRLSPAASAPASAQAPASGNPQVNALFARLAETVGGAVSLTADVAPDLPAAGLPAGSAAAPVSAQPVPLSARAGLELPAPAAAGAEGDVADAAAVLPAGAAAQIAKPAAAVQSPRAASLRPVPAAEGASLLADPEASDLADGPDRSPLANRLAATAEGQFASRPAMRGTAGADAALSGAAAAAGNAAQAAAAGRPDGESPAMAIAVDAAMAAAEFGESLGEADALFGARGAGPMTRAEAQAANLPGPQMAQAAAAQVAAQMQQQARPGQSRFQIRLDPAELGRIDVEMTVTKDGEVKAKLTVDKPETLDLFMRDQRSLERALEAAGLKADQGSLQFSLRDEGGRSFSFAGDGSERGSAGQHGEDGRHADADAAEADRLVSERVAQLYRGKASGGLDIRI